MKSVAGAVLPLLIFRPRQRLAEVWEVARLPFFGTMARRRVSLILIWSLILFFVSVLLCRFGSTGRTADGTVVQRTWWYAVPAARLPEPANAASGLHEWFYLPSSDAQSFGAILWRSVLRLPQHVGDVFGHLRHALQLGWMRSAILLVIGWYVLVGWGSHIGLGKAHRVLLLLGGMLYPVLTVLSLLLVAKLGYVFWWWGEWPVYALGVVSIATILWVPAGFLRMGLRAPAATWRVIWLLLLALVCWLEMLRVATILIPDTLWNWV